MELLKSENVTIVDVEFDLMMEVIFMCERLLEVNDVHNRIDEDNSGDGFWNSFVRGFQVG